MTRRPLTGGELQQRAISGSLWTAIHTVVSVPLAFVANAAVARILGPSSYGELAFLTLAIGIVAVISNLGVSDAVIQWGSAAEARGDRQEADGLLKKSLGYHLLVQLPMLVVAVLVLARRDPLWVKGALIVGVTLPAALGSSALAISIENKTAAGARLVMGTNLITQASLVLAAALSHSAAGVWATRSVAASCLLPLNLFLLDRARRRVARSVSLPTGFPRGFWRYAAQTGLAGVLAILVFSRSEIFLLQTLASPSAVGQFALAFGVAAQITAPADALLGPLIPAVAGLLSSAPGASTRAFERSLRFASLLSGGILALVLPPLYFLMPTIYGVAFRSAADILVPLAAMSCVQSCFNPVIAFLSARRMGGLIVNVYMIAFVVDVAVAVVAIPRIGVWGAVVANVAGQITAFGMLGLAEAREHTRSAGGFLQELSAGGIGFGAMAAAVGIPLLALGNSVASAPAALLIGATAYGLGLRLLGTGLTEGDRAALAGALHPRLARFVLRLDRLVSRAT